MSRWGSTGVFDSSQLTAVKQTRNVYANALAQRTAVDKAGKPFMRIQSASAGEGGPVNGFSIASDTGALNLTQAEFDAIVAQETPGPSGPPPTLTFTWDGSGGTQLNITTIPPGYTSLSYILCGGGGAGGFGVYTGSGGGSGGYRNGTIAVSSGQNISVSFGTGGSTNTSQGTNGADGIATVLTVNTNTVSAGGGGGGKPSTNSFDDVSGGSAGIPNGSAGFDTVAQAPSNGGSGGGGGGGGGSDNNYIVGGGGPGEHNASPGSSGNSDTGDSSSAGAGGDGYYSLVLT